MHDNAEGEGVDTDGPSEPLNSELADQFSAAVKKGAEMERSEDSDKSPAQSIDDQVPGIKFLASLIKATIFTDLFVYHAEVRYVHRTRQERVDALITAHPRFYNLCRNADFVSRALLLTITVLLVGAAAAGTILKLFYL